MCTLFSELFVNFLYLQKKYKLNLKGVKRKSSMVNDIYRNKDCSVYIFKEHEINNLNFNGCW